MSQGVAMFRGEVWELTGQKGKGEAIPRVVVIISADALGSIPLRVVVPLTPWQETYARAPWILRVPPVLNSGLENPHAADALQVRSVSISRLTRRLGELPEAIIAEIARAVGLVLALPLLSGV
jgi:mRNA interferase MazF